jgi:hypothetical protein
MVYHLHRMLPEAQCRMSDARTSCRTWLVAGLLAILLLPERAPAQELASDAPDEQQAQEREQAQKIRRAREDLESRRAEAARRLEAGQLRQREIGRLQGDVSAVVRRESYLGHEAHWVQRDRDSLSRDPSDHSSMVRRSDLDHRLTHHRNELDRAGALRQSGTSQLNGLQLR